MQQEAREVQDKPFPAASHFQARRGRLARASPEAAEPAGSSKWLEALVLPGRCVVGTFLLFLEPPRPGAFSTRVGCGEGVYPG